MNVFSNDLCLKNPNAPNRQKFLTTTELDWPEYDGINKTFLSLGVPPKIAHHYRQKKMDFWNEHIPEVFKNLPPNESSKNNNPDKPEILPPEPYFPRKPFFPFHPERKPEIITWYNGLPVFSSTPPPRVYGTLVKSGNEKPRSATSGLLGVDGGFGSKFALENSPKTTDSPSEVAAGNSSSMAMSIVIVVGVCLLLVNLCAFAGLYYQRDKLKVREKLMKKRYEDVENVNNEDFYMKKKPEEREDDNIEVIEMTTKKDNRKKKLQQSGDELYEAVRSRGKTHEGNEDKVEGDDGDESGFKRWKLSRQCSSSTMDPHTKVREWIAHEIVQRCSPRFLRKTKNQHQTIRPILQKDSSFDTFIEHDPSAVALEENKHPIPSSPALSKPATTTTLQRAKVKKVSVAVDATPGARGSSVMKQIPVEQMSKSMEELGLGKCISTSEITLQQKRAALKRSETCRESLARSSSSSSDPTNRDTVLRRSTTSISLQLSKPALNAKDNSLTISHQHSKSDPVPNSMQYVVQNSNCPHNSQFVNISLDSKGGVSSPVTAKGGLKKQMKSFQTTGPHSKGKVLKEVPIPTTPVPKSATDVNVTSRDSSDNPEEVQTTDPLKTIQRRNFPKVLPDLPPAQDVSHFEKESKDSEREFTSVQALAAKRRSLPPPIHLMVGLEPPPSEAGSISQPTTPTSPYQKEYFTQTGKVPPPPPPRISSTLGRKPSNTAPVSQLSSSFDSQDSEYIISPAPSPTYHQRQEPRVIIKPTSTAPVSRNPSQQGRDKTHIPRVVPNTGEEYPLTPTAIHHHYHHQHHQTNDVTSPSPSLSRQSSVRCQGPQSPVLPTQQSATVSKTPVKFPHSYQHPTKPINQQTIPTSQTESSQQQPMIHSPSKTITQQQTHKPALQNKADDSMVTPTSQAKSVSQKVPAKKSIEASTSSSLPSEDTSSNTGTVKRVKKGHDPKAKTAGGNQSTSSTSSNKGTTAPKAWYAQYNQSFLSKSKDSDK
ncbi:hypothetical protein C0J52_07891 [Blattella germanica]|nr:hypothetical protein C0J52_07891 [Blattella germanica]